MKNGFKQIIHITCVLLIFILCYLKVNEILCEKSSYKKYNDFMTSDDDYDVLLFGTSHMQYGIIPMELWEEYNITSYNFGNSGCQIPVTYYSIINSTKIHKPKLVVIDVYSLSSNEKLNKNLGWLHTGFDEFPLTKDKINAVNDLLDNKKERLGFLFPFYSYHSRWDALTNGDFIKNANSYSKGGSVLINVEQSVKELSLLDENVLPEEPSMGMEYLEKSIEYLQRNDIEVLLVSIPYIADEVQQPYENSAEKIAEKYGVKYLNLYRTEGIIDYKTDFMINHNI